jgi:DMSO/TMAO reductase YedYZ molybdopterin-dependent catalytic subunit
MAGMMFAGLTIAAGETAAAFGSGSRSPLAGLGRVLIDATPGAAIDVGVALVGETDKPLMALGLGIGTGLAGAGTALLAPARPHTAALLAVAPTLLGSAYGLRLSGGHQAWTAIAGLCAAVTAAAGTHVVCAGPDEPRQDRLRTAGTLLFAAGITVAARRVRGALDERARRRWILSPSANDAPAPTPAPPGLAPQLTGPDELYKVDVTFPAPRLDGHSWRLKVHGEVNSPLDLSLPDLLDSGMTEIDALLICVHNPVGGHRMGNGRWTALPLATLLERAGLPDELAADPSRAELIARSIDGFAVALPLDVALERALVAVGLGGRPLPFGNGFPARLLVPGKYGYAGNVKWLAGLEVRRTEPAARHAGARGSGYWTSRGWPADGGNITPSSRIDVPRAGSRLDQGPMVLAGYAWAPPEGVLAVEVSVDDGPWAAAQLAAELSGLCWRSWSLPWKATPGRHVLRVRCFGVVGRQDEREGAPYPHGPSGVHTVPVHVGSAGRTRQPAAALAGFRLAVAARLRLAVESGRAWR